MLFHKRWAGHLKEMNKLINKDRKRDPKTMKRKTARWKRRKRKTGKEIKRILGPEKQRKKNRKSGKYTHNYGGGLGNMDC